MNEQFSPIPVRAGSDTRLSANDFRIMVTIAYFDRLGRNGYGCIVDPRRIAELAAVDYSHIARHTRRLQKFGYLNISCRPNDRRKRMFSLIYHEESDVADEDGIEVAGPERRSQFPGVTSGPSMLDDGDNTNGKFASGGDQHLENVAKANPQAIGLAQEPLPNRSCKAEIKKSCEATLRDPAKPAAKPFHDISGPDALIGELARQGVRACQTQAQHKSTTTTILDSQRVQPQQSRGIDWNGWIKWRMEVDGLSREKATLAIMEEIDRIQAENGVDHEEAESILDRQLKRRRKLMSLGRTEQ